MHSNTDNTVCNKNKEYTQYRKQSDKGGGALM